MPEFSQQQMRLIETTADLAAERAVDRMTAKIVDAIVPREIKRAITTHTLSCLGPQIAAKKDRATKIWIAIIGAATAIATFGGVMLAKGL